MVESQLRDLESLVCATLQSVLRKMRPEDTPYIGDAIMQGLLQIMQRCAGKECGGVMEDALMAVSTLIGALGCQFATYLDVFKPFLVAGLQNHEEGQVCSAAIGVLVDLCRALEASLMPHLDEFMGLLFQIVQSDKIDRLVKPAVLSCFGDVALAIGPNFTRYYEYVMAVLVMALSTAKVEDPEDYDNVEYVEQLRESCVEAYTGIVQGMRTTQNNELQQLRDQIQNMLGLIELIATSNSPNSLIGAASGLLGDLVMSFGEQILPYVDNQNISAMLTKGRRSKAAKTKSLALWATQEIRKLKTVKMENHN
uniref:Importin subunit beta-1/Transportin-1-like TPR repeats domain-containing protein n=1 Tax=Setaria digitata TaxID=48799 RepID=A0A915Q815_9BILA